VRITYIGIKYGEVLQREKNRRIRKIEAEDLREEKKI